MNFDLSDEQRAIADAVRSVLEDRLGDAKIGAYLERVELDEALWSEVCGLGVCGILVREASGGMQMDMVTMAVIAEVLGSYAAPLPIVPNALAAWLIDRSGSPEQRDRWLSKLISGEAKAAFALGEAEDRWLPDTWTLRRGESGGGSLTGWKRNVEWGAAADLFIVGLSGDQLALVEANDTTVRHALDSVDRTRRLADVEFRESAAQSIEGGAESVSQLVDALLVLLAADACGAAATALSRAVNYAKERKQYGQLIGSFQALKHQLADMAVEVEPSRPLCWYAAHAWDVYPEKRARVAALTKAHVTDGAVSVARAAVEAHGGIGYTWEYPLHIFLKRAVFDRTYLGGPRVHRERMARLANW